MLGHVGDGSLGLVLENFGAAGKRRGVIVYWPFCRELEVMTIILGCQIPLGIV
jgi:hypothetical protein